MEISIIREWFSAGRPFDKGVELYQEYGSNAGIKILLATGEFGFSRMKLEEAMEGLMQKAVRNQLKSTTGEKKKEGDIISSIRASLTPDSYIERLEKELKDCYRNQSNCHSKMKVSFSQNKRKKYAFEILEIGRNIRRIISTLKYIEQHGQEPPEMKILNVEDLEDRADLKQRQLNNRGYISKNKKRAEPEKIAEVRKRLAENEEIDKILNNGSNSPSDGQI